MWLIKVFSVIYAICAAQDPKDAVTHMLQSTPSTQQQTTYEIPVPSLRQETQWLDVFPTESFKLSCEIQQGSDWTYTWYRDEKEVHADSTVTLGTNGATLSISSALPEHKGAYKCKGHRQDVTSSLSSELRLRVYDEKPIPTLTQSPTYKVMFAGESVSFSCHISVSSGWEYMFYKDGSQLSGSGNKHSINSITTNNQGLYTCKVKRGNNQVFLSDSSTSINLEVKDEKPIPTLTQSPTYKVMFAGESVSFSCHISVSSGWEYMFYKDGSQLSGSGNEHSINSITTNNQGLYTCKVKRGNNQVFLSDSSTSINLEVRDEKPIPTLTQSPTYKVMFAGESVSFSCHISVSSGWEYMFYKDGSQLSGSGNEHSINSIATNNQGSYTCKAKRGNNQVFTDSSTSINLEVRDEKPIPTLTQSPTYKVMFAGESVSFSCHISVSSGWEYMFYKDGSQLSGSGNKHSINSITTNNQGLYTCKVKRGNNQVFLSDSSTSINLEVRDEKPIPTLTQSPTYKVMFAGESVSFSCHISVSSGWEYMFYKDGSQLSGSGNEHSINSIATNNQGSYTCKAKRGNNQVFTDSSTSINLEVRDEKPIPTLTQSPTYKVMFAGESVSFSCHISVSSGWEYMFFKDGSQLSGSGNEHSINSIATNNQGSYTCKAKRGNNQVFTDSSTSINLEVIEKKPKPLTTKRPDDDKVYIGETVVFECNVAISSGWEYHWLKNGRMHVNSSSFKIVDASSSNNGSYECVATRDKSEYQTERSDPQNLQISEIPVPTLKNLTPWSDVFPTEAVSLGCGMDDTSDWTYTWYRDGQKIQGDRGVNFGTDGVTLFIHPASASHSGKYNCSAKLKDRTVYSTTSSAQEISVYDTKPRVTLIQNPPSSLMHTEDLVSFSCHVNVSSGWEYMWLKDGTQFSNSESDFNISSALTSNSGTYSCKVKRGKNSVFISDPSQAMGLSIAERPKADIVLLTGWSEVFATDSLVLKCEVKDSEDKWNYTWYRAEQEIVEPPAEKHTVTPHEDPENSLYTCKGHRTERPFYSRVSNAYKTKNLLLKRRVLLSISGCLFFGLIIGILGCIVLRFIRKPAGDEDKTNEENLFISMAQLKNRTDAPLLVEYVTDAALNAPPKEGGENGTVCNETDPLPISTEEDQALKTETNDKEENNGGMVSFKQ